MGEVGDNLNKGFHIKDWREGDRPREMLLKKGANNEMAKEKSACPLFTFHLAPIASYKSAIQ